MDADIQISMDIKGAWRDNVFPLIVCFANDCRAVIERLWRTIKYEEVYLRAYESCQLPAKVWADIWSSTTAGDRTHRWTRRHPISRTSNRCDQSRSQRIRAGIPFKKRFEIVQTDRTTSL